MKKLIETLIGAEVHASAKNINGRKSSGTEDVGSLKHWKSLDSHFGLN